MPTACNHILQNQVVLLPKMLYSSEILLVQLQNSNLLYRHECEGPKLSFHIPRPTEPVKQIVRSLFLRLTKVERLRLILLGKESRLSLAL